MIQGLLYIHEVLLTVHRDIKPSNIFMNSDFNIKIGDLGLIKPLLSCNSSNDKISGDSY
ncbi:MAG: protein kinase domain-containing protein [bacterium]